MAFVTLIEQKILASISVRVGPNYVGYRGMLQRFADAVKLFLKENIKPFQSILRIYLISPVLRLILRLIIWLVTPINNRVFYFSFSILFFICVRGVCVYPVLSTGWSSNCKYSILGRLRRVAQIISYEVSLTLILISLVMFNNDYSLITIIKIQIYIYNIFIFYPLGIIWFVSSLAETNRTPYDFSEGESELVSGFNTEYRARGFTLIFIAEYASIIFIGFLFVILFIRSLFFNILIVTKGLFLVFLFIWVRATLPRYRYDKLINLAWKRFLPISLSFFFFYSVINLLLNN